MLEEHGFDMAIFDLFYANDPGILTKQYDFITSTEVWEHLKNPNEVINELFQLGKERFALGIMTKRIPETPFGDWHYIKDPTHITFFAEQTLKYIAKKYKCELHLPESDTAIFLR
jgi:2-polyprenyl-3-methyl-5-hydroxy-6-metoxy-1,4-benzoquinol methylase